MDRVRLIDGDARNRKLSERVQETTIREIKKGSPEGKPGKLAKSWIVAIFHHLTAVI